MAPCAAGENEVALAPGYAANVEVASADAAAGRAAGDEPAPVAVDTPGLRTIAAVAASSRSAAGAPAEGVPGRGRRAAGWSLVLRARRPPRQRDQAAPSAGGAVAARRGRRRSPSGSGRPASSGRSALDGCPCCSTTASPPAAPTSSGANRAGRPPARRRARPRLRLRARRRARRSRPATRVAGAADHDRAGDRGRQHLQARDALLGAARRHLPRRARARAADLDGLLRDRHGAHRGGRGRAVRRRARASPGRARSRRSRCTWSGSGARAAHERAARRARSTSAARARGVDVLYDDREAGPGEKFADAELLGCPLRLTVGRARARVGRDRGRRSAAAGEARGAARVDGAPRRAGRWRSWREPRGDPLAASARARADQRRLFGLDRSGPPPPQTASGPPLRPWTIPNAIGYVRARADPAVPRLAYARATTARGALAASSSRCGWADYARRLRGALTGQYSRLGALLDPCRPPARARGVAVCWSLRAAAALAARAAAARELADARLGRLAERGVGVRDQLAGADRVGPTMLGLCASAARRPRGTARSSVSPGWCSALARDRARTCATAAGAAHAASSST